MDRDESISSFSVVESASPIKRKFLFPYVKRIAMDASLSEPSFKAFGPGASVWNVAFPMV